MGVWLAHRVKSKRPQLVVSPLSSLRLRGGKILVHSGGGVGSAGAGRAGLVMKRLLTFALAVVLGATVSTGAQASVNSTYDKVTDAQALAARKAIESSLERYAEDNTSVNVYTVDELNTYVENGIYLKVIHERDKCQFTPDIEDRARIVGMPAFEFVWGDMLIKGICVKQDAELGLDYLQKAVAHAYAPAMMQLADYYERGFLVPQNKDTAISLMRAAAAVGSPHARLAWADMLVRGLGAPAYYEEAFSWLYHSLYLNEYDILKSQYLQSEMKKMMPPNIVARAMSNGYYNLNMR